MSPKSMINERFRLIKYSETDSLFKRTVPYAFLWQEYGLGYYQQVTSFPNDYIKIVFQIQPSVLVAARYPSTIIMALAKIGGLLALMRIGFFLQWLHRWQFEKKLYPPSRKAPDGKDDENVPSRI